ELGAEVQIGHAAENVRGASVVVRSSAVPDDNVEVRAAHALGIPVLKRSEYLKDLLDGYFTIAVAGTHGKTTTTAMLAWVLTALDQQPSFIVGGDVANLGTNARAGEGAAFVIEADEYDYMFLGLEPTIAVVTNVEHDHPDCFPTEENFVEAFEDFVDRLSIEGTLIAYDGDPVCVDLLEQAAEDDNLPVSYGIYADEDSTVNNTISLDGVMILNNADVNDDEDEGDEDIANDQPIYNARDLQPQPGAGYSFAAYRLDEFLMQVNLQVPGRHNVLNALAVIAVTDLLTLPAEQVAAALGQFVGAGRRFEVAGEAAGVLVIDDYGHHPTEIRATLGAARDRYPDRRIWAVWQPHTYSRVLDLQDEFANAFGNADRVVVTDVFAARESRPEDFVIEDVVASVQHSDAVLKKTLAEAAVYLIAQVKANDVILVLSAGDATEISRQVLQALGEEAQQNV
ncbi:MAG: UDP-N-acetylmuramate--L-alanine ligase, partial [Anaerolineales bacterium]|nr:UDP-N-acetylmuramate--L-alanine ligase [Anaerolineales bacterium]